MSAPTPAAFFNLSDGNPYILIENLPASIDEQKVSMKNMGYQEPQGQLSNLILDVHHRYHRWMPLMSHNVVTLGAGSTQVLYNAILSLRKILGRRVLVWYQRPYYMYLHQLLSDDTNVILISNEEQRDNADLEIITSPNNPTGESRGAETKATYKIVDCAYAWPCYTNSVPQLPTDENTIYVFSFSKMTGLGGLRVGWCVSSDSQWTREIQNRIFLTHLSCTIPSLSIVGVFLNYVISDSAMIDAIWNTTRRVMEELRCVFAQFLPVRNNEGPYAWVEMDKSTLERKYFIIGTDGASFGAPGYTRLSLMGGHVTRNALLEFFR